MFDLDEYEGKLHNEQPAAPTEKYQHAKDIKEMSLLFWGEHCVECAAPSCYQSCDLYQPRPDKRCRRFAYGAFKNREFPSLRGYGVEISFKKWAKIEAYGNLALRPAKSVLMQERLMQAAAPAANIAGKILGKLTKNDNWDSATYIASERLSQRLNRKKSSNELPDVFLIEVYNPTSEAVRMQLNFNSTSSEAGKTKNLIELGPSFVTTVTFPRGYSRHEIEVARLLSVVASGKPFKISMIPEADNNARLVFLTADFVRYAKRPAPVAKANKIKCVVWDLDNTLWKGILIEGDDVVVRPEVRQLLMQLDERGILLSISSKNDHAYAWQKLEELGLSEYFLYPQINWAPKSLSIKTIAERLNIGIDTFAFIDDNPFELDQVARTLPEVTCVNAEDISSVLCDARFEGSASAEARQRRSFYKEAMARESAQEDFGSNYVGFLATCGIKLEISHYSPEDSERVAELVQRTNQLNFSGHKYTRSQLNEILANDRLEKYVLKSSDSYGSYGTVGFSIVEHGAGFLHVRDFMLSCRVQGKFIEQAFFHHLFAHHNPEAATALWVNFHHTDRNKPAQQVLDTLGFRAGEPETKGPEEGVMHSSPDSLRCDFIAVLCSETSPAIEKTPLTLSGNHTPAAF